MKHFITIFTPTYNRAYIISKLYKSLLMQTYKDFEWLIVDDGSTDKTQELIQSFSNQNKINIIYFKQENGGKHRAINQGVKLAKGELFFIVDSDDYLPSNSLERIIYHWRGIENDESFAGISGFMRYPNGTIIGGGMKYNIIDSNLIERRGKYNIQGDMAKVLKTKVLKNFPFPDFPGEKFVAESIVWNRLAEKYKIRYINEAIYVAKYLDDGLSFNSIRNRRKNPNYTCLLYKELANNKKITLRLKVKALTNYWRFSFCKKGSFQQKITEIGNFPLNIMLYLFGLILYYKDCYNSDIKINNK